MLNERKKLIASLTANLDSFNTFVQKLNKKIQNATNFLLNFFSSKFFMALWYWLCFKWSTMDKTSRNLLKYLLVCWLTFERWPMTNDYVWQLQKKKSNVTQIAITKTLTHHSTAAHKMRINSQYFNVLARLDHLFWLIILIQFVSFSRPQRNNFPTSPCPNVFLYKYNGQEWYGEIRAPIALMLQQQSALLKVTFTLKTANVSDFRLCFGSEIRDSVEIFLLNNFNDLVRKKYFVFFFILCHFFRCQNGIFTFQWKVSIVFWRVLLYFWVFSKKMTKILNGIH